MAETIKGLDLDGLFATAIAKLDKIPESQVTADYIEEQRKKKIYPFARFDRGMTISGHSCIGLKSYTGDQRNRIGELADEVMDAV